MTRSAARDDGHEFRQSLVGLVSLRRHRRTFRHPPTLQLSTRVAACETAHAEVQTQRETVRRLARNNC